MTYTYNPGLPNPTPLGNSAYLPTGGNPVDAYGNIVQPNQAVYVVRINYNSAIAGLPQGPGVPVYAVNPNYNPNSSTGGAGGSQTSVVTPPHYRITFDTIGQTIYRSIGHCRLPLRIIWAQGVNYPGSPENIVSPTLTFAAALCAPIDPDEAGQVAVMFNGNNAIFDTDHGGIIIPDGLSVEDATALQKSLQNAVIYPGDESQLPSPLIVADKGANVTNAFRGLRYIVLPLYPLIEGFGGTGGGLSIVWRPENTGQQAAVEFAAGSG